MTKSIAKVAFLGHYGVLQLSHADYSKSIIGTISVVMMTPAHDSADRRRALFVADGQDYESNKSGYQPKFLGAFTDPRRADEVIRMHAFYAGGITDADLLTLSDFNQEEMFADVAKHLHEHDSREEFTAEDVVNAPHVEHKPLDPQLAQALAHAPQEAIDQIMALNDAGTIVDVNIVRVTLGDPDL